MRVTGISIDEVRRTAAPLGLVVVGNGGDYLLGRDGDRWNDGTAWACWHGYEALIEALLEEYPDARIKTAVTTYRGLADFDERQHEVALIVERRFGRKPCNCPKD